MRFDRSRSLATAAAFGLLVTAMSLALARDSARTGRCPLPWRAGSTSTRPR